MSDVENLCELLRAALGRCLTCDQHHLGQKRGCDECEGARALLASLASADLAETEINSDARDVNGKVIEIYEHRCQGKVLEGWCGSWDLGVEQGLIFCPMCGKKLPSAEA